MLTPHKLIIVDANSRKKTRIRDGTITSFAWLSDAEVVYCTGRTKGSTKRFVISRIGLDTQQKTDVFAFPERPKSISIGSGDWSPSGKFLILMEPEAVHGQYHCVNISDGTVRSFGQTDASDVGVAWAPDSSQAFCVSRKIGPGDVYYEAILLEAATGKTVDCTSGFQETFEDDCPDFWGLEPIWTVDGKYVLVNCLGTGGNLVQPDPWKVIPLGQILAPKFDTGKKSTIRPRLFRLPVPGWVGVLHTEKQGDFPLKYVADYSGEQVRALQETHAAISPDGTMAATIGEDRHVKIHRLGKWWAVSDETPLSRPAAK